MTTEAKMSCHFLMTPGFGKNSLLSTALFCVFFLPCNCFYMFLLEIHLNNFPFSFLLVPLSTLLQMPFLALQFERFFFFMTVINDFTTGINMCLGVSLYGNTYKYNLLNMFLLFVCIWVRDWPRWDRQLIWWLIPGRDLISSSQQPLVYYSFVSSGEITKISTFHVNVSTYTVFVLSLLMQPHLADMVSEKDPRYSGPYTHPAHSSAMVFFLKRGI